jgi:hypothetical protein
MDTRLRVAAALRLGAHASIRYAVLLLAVLSLPLLLIAFVFWQLGSGSAAMLIVVALLLFPLTVIAHEIGHAVAFAALAPRQAGAPMVAAGRWLSAGIDRPRLSPGRDAAVTLAGPLTGMLLGVPVLLAPVQPGLVSIAGGILIIGFHLMSLLPPQHDYRALTTAGAERMSTHGRSLP